MAAMPPGEPYVDVTFEVTREEYDALERLAADLGIPVADALRQALADELAIRGLLAEGAVIRYRMPDGSGGEIAF
jgi:Ribbon-helix-helix protein, copG family